MDDFLKVKYFDDLFDIFSSQNEGWYSFYADYTHNTVHWSQEIVDLLGLPSRVMNNDEALSLYLSYIHPEDLDGYMSEVKKMMDGEIDELNIPYRLKTKSGEYITVGTYSKFKRDEEGNPVFYAGSVVNFHKMNFIEPTTGLYTTVKMIDMMDTYFTEQKGYFLLIFGIRDLSSINNKYGYIAGNQVLHTVANVAMAYRNGATVYKLEGTKFAMLKSFDLDDPSIREYGSKEFDNIKKQLSQGIKVDNTIIYVDIYGGAVYTNEKGITPNTVYTSALFALSKAKDNNSSDALNIFNQSWLEEERHQLSLYESIRDSIKDECKGFFLVYQPIISSETGKLCAMEALLRWYGDDCGEIFPGTFIEWLEKDPVFFDLGNWILRRALEDVKKIISIIPDFIVNINLAYPQLGRDDFEENLKRIVDESCVNPKNIRLELTERCKLLDEKLLIKKMYYIQSLGIQTSLDDFGTGYSAINLLFDLPSNQIKIDRFFIQNIQNEESKSIMLKAIIDCARKNGAHVCVEGIETKEMADYIMNNFNITSLQGFYYSRPVRLEVFLENMHKWM
jgi:EAL domain-containing protein (putative c-di-GMP-specific phosphodiesterase class I)